MQHLKNFPDTDICSSYFASLNYFIFSLPIQIHILLVQYFADYLMTVGGGGCSTPTHPLVPALGWGQIENRI